MANRQVAKGVRARHELRELLEFDPNRFVKLVQFVANICTGAREKATPDS